jgi:dTDP-4-amino-4,6-dideoxygalactose transaminase
MIPVTRTFLPPLDAYQALVKRAFDAHYLTNRGPMVVELEAKLREYLGVQNILMMTNGTIPLQIAVKLLGNGGEIITTPFSYVATTSSIVWEGCTPVFVDIHPEYLTIDETKIEAAITPRTTAILATHVFGNPCHVEAIEVIALKHGLKIIYDGAHAFGVNYHAQSLFNFGDVSTCSFHATKLFHTGEGGAIFCSDKELANKIYYSHNFGHDGPLAFQGLGINGKMSELQAAMGLAVFPYLETIIEQRKELASTYSNLLCNADLTFLKIRKNTDWNYSYFPVLFRNESDLSRVVEALNNSDIFPRRYFFPSLNTLPYLSASSMPISESVAARIACLPIYPGLEMAEVHRITAIIKNAL